VKAAGGNGALADAGAGAAATDRRARGPEPALSVSEVGVSFGGLHALDGVSLDVRAGRVTGLIGPNGAGKTTLFDVICGLRPATQGRVLLDGTDITRLAPYRRVRAGIGRTFQRIEVFGSLRVRDNVLLAAEAREQWSAAPVDPRRVTDEVLERVGLTDVAEAPVGSLSTGTTRLVEVGRALAGAPRVLLLDEPSSGLDDAESAPFADLLHSLAHDDGLAVLIVEHDMPLVMGVCEWIFVLDLGRLIADGPPSAIQGERRVRDAYLGVRA